MSEIRSKKIELVDIDKIVPNPKNNNKHPEEQIERLAKLIKHNGFRVPVIVSNRSGFLICGHGRVAAAKKIGLEKVPVSYQDFKDEAEEYQLPLRWGLLAFVTIVVPYRNPTKQCFCIQSI